MSTANAATPTRPVIYPECDGEPMAENTDQYQAIVTIKENLELAFQDDPTVFVAADLFWYPVEGDPAIRTAPDTLVAFGVPKGRRGSYRTWDERGITPQVIFEVLSPGNRFGAMLQKFHFYEQYGVEEYYIFDPDDGQWQGWIRKQEKLSEITSMDQWVSPRLKIRFESSPGPEVRLYFSNGERFLTTIEREALQRESEGVARLERLARTQAQQRADRERERADQERERADQERQRADQERERADRMAARLRAAGIDPEAS